MTDQQTTGGNALDPRFFRRCLGQFATGVTVVTTNVGGKNYGVTANSFSSVSLDPPLVSWAIGNSSRSFETFRSAGAFNIHVLSAAQVDVSQRFSASVEDKFAGFPLSLSASGAPEIPDVLALLQCRHETAIDAGDHVIILGRVTAASHRDGDPLVFAQGRYRAAIEHPALKIADTPKPSGDAGPATSPLFKLLFDSFHAMVDQFAEHRAEAGLSVIQLRVLVGATDQPGAPLSSLMQRMHLTPLEAGDALSDLIERGALRKDERGHVWPTDAGRDLRRSMNARVVRFEDELLSGVPAEQLAATRQLLKRVISKRTPSKMQIRTNGE